MDCERVREALLEQPARLARETSVSWDGAGASADEDIPAHLLTCPACAAFAAQQRALDERLARAFAPPALSPSFRPALRARLRRERTRARRDALPDIVHFASCGVATLVSAALAPVPAPTILISGATIALGSYVLVSLLSQSFNDLEQPDR
jgi:anti-sigma factor RsiW